MRMKYCTAYHVAAFWIVTMAILCADGLGDLGLLPFLGVCAAVFLAARFLWKRGEDALYYHNRRVARRRAHEARKIDAAAEIAAARHASPARHGRDGRAA